jgi:hypothetical protein
MKNRPMWQKGIIPVAGSKVRIIQGPTLRERW